MDRFTVATYGLDPLDQTRIRLACSLLLAENLSIDFVDDKLSHDLNIFGLDNVDGITRWKENKSNNNNALLISRQYQGGAPWLAHGTTVSEFRKFIHQTLLIKIDDGSSQEHVGSDYPLILEEILNPTLGVTKKYRHRSMECVVDSKTRNIYLKDNVSILDFIALVRAKGWASIPFNESEQTDHSTFFKLRVSFESVIFALSGADCLKVAKVRQDHFFKLKLWPELIAETISSAQLLAIARLHARSWQPQNLADVCHLNLTTTLGLITAALECGLLVVDKKPPVVEKEKSVPKETGFLVWVARRFGLRT